MNTEGAQLKKKYVSKDGKGALNDMVALAFGLLLMYVAKDFVDSVWSVFHLPF